ncbi:MAG: HlyD family type I secretion periplasmic adaptor subunit [Hyphomicrobiales bacterium]
MATAAKAALPAKIASPGRLDPRDQEFLPAAIEILQTPPSPIGTSLLLYICAAFLCVLAWSYFGFLDIYAVAAGKIQLGGQSKVVQPLYPGKITAIHVENGSRVAAGDVLIELDPTESGADREAQTRGFAAAGAEAARRRAAIAAARTVELKAPPIEFPPGTEENLQFREQDVLAADLGELRSTIASLRAQLAEKQATKLRLLANIEARKSLIALGKESVAMQELLTTRGAGSRKLVIDALEQYQTYLVADAGDRGQLLETDAAMLSIESKIEEAGTQFIATQAQKLADAERERDKLEQDLVKAQLKRDLTRLTAPIAGTVQQLGATTIGQVVASGQSLMTIVPLEGPLEIEAMIANKDIGFIEPGQSAVVKIEAFPFTRYGTLDATVTKVSRDAVDDRYATNLSDAANAARSQGAAGQPSQAPNLVYPTTLTFTRRTILVGDSEVALAPGMTVMVEIKTGRRRAIDYLLSPLREFVGQTAHER